MHAGRKDVTLKSIKLAGKQLSAEQYERTDKKLIVRNLPSGSFEAEVEVDIKPQARAVCCTSASAQALVVRLACSLHNVLVLTGCRAAACS